MRTRNAGSSKTAAAKKTPPTRKSASKSPANAQSPQTKRTSTIKTRQAKKNEASPLQNTSVDEEPELLSDEAKAEADASQVTPETKVVTVAKSAPKRTPKRAVGRPRNSTKAITTREQEEQVEAITDETPKMDDVEVAEKLEEPLNVNVVKADEIENKEVDEQGVEFVRQSAGNEQHPKVGDECNADSACELEEKRRDIVEDVVSASQGVPFLLNQEEPTMMEHSESLENEEPTSAKEGEQTNEEDGEKASEKSMNEQTTCSGIKELCDSDSVSMEIKDQREQVKEEDGEKESEKSMEKEGEGALEKSMQEETSNIIHNQESNTDSVEKEMTNQFLQDDVKPGKENPSGDQGGKGSEERLNREEQGGKELEADRGEPLEEAETLDEERKELSTMAKERKIKKENEIFVGGLDRDATEEDLKKVFEKIGEIVEVRLHKDSSTNKNKGYAFVKFSCKEHAKKALSEIKSPIICGKRCGIAPSEDNDTLFLGNICNTWTKEAIKQKLKDYGVEGVENITLVPDVHREGLSRGFAFLEFSCHHDAMLAYKRLQKPDVVFGHADRTVKVAFAEPARELDPEIMAQVKSVFVDGLPPHWDEGCIREHLKGYGEIVRIVLARNMTTAKRKDFGFVDFSTHEAAVACVDGVNSSEFVDGKEKIKVRARLSNPLPKTQAVKGGMCGGFRIGHARGGAFPRSGERMIPLRGGHYAGAQGAAVAGPSRPHLDRAWYGTPERGPGEPIPPRTPFSPEGQFDRPFIGRHIDDPYFYEDSVHGVKRPFYMTDPDPSYMGPVRLRPRLDYTDPAVFHGSRYHDSIASGRGQYPHDYYGADYGGGPYSSFYGGENSHGRRYHY
ncbi:nucleolin-like isoform X2 [Neltuma alba]|uniref:nucleolin-like isoform X2 n=1 Tax=Neltuma alba TaxID=207710 RepID=UPI0010A43D07|nr:nucleolin-like isoform X2 [Prosopis alba]